MSWADDTTDDQDPFKDVPNIITSKNTRTFTKEEADKINKEEPIPVTDEQIEDICKSLIITSTPNECQEQILQNHKNNIRNELKDIKLKPSRFQEYKNTVICNFYKSLIAPGESAGTNAAQNISEPTTQQSLSRYGRIPLMLKFPTHTEYYSGPIGDIIDKIMSEWCDIIHTLPGGGEFATPTSVRVYVNTVDPITSRCDWKLVEQVSRHPSNGNMIKVITKSGRSTVTTLSHSHLKLTQHGIIIPIRGDELNIGDSIPVCKQMNINEKLITSGKPEVDGIPLDFDMGWMFGAYLAGSIVSTNNNLLLNSDIDFTNVNVIKRIDDFVARERGRLLKINGDIVITGCSHFIQFIDKYCGKHKQLPSFCLFSPLTFISGLLRGYFDSNYASSDAFEITSVSKNLIENLSLLLNKFGIFGAFSKSKQDSYKYRIAMEYRSLFITAIGSDYKYDTSLNEDFKYLDNFEYRNNVIWDEITRLKIINDPHELVYDLGVYENHTFMVQSGIFTHNTLNTFHASGISAKNVTLGFPRAKELFNATSTPSNPMCTIYFTKHNQSMDEIHKVTDKLTQAKINDLIKSWVVIVPTDYKPLWWHKTFQDLYKVDPPKPDEWILRLKFNIQKLYDHDITLQEIQEICCKKYGDIRCVYSPLNIGIIDILVDCTEINMKNPRLEELPTDKDDQIINNDETRAFYMKNIVSVELRNIMACGIPLISKLYPRKTKTSDYGQPLKPEIKAKLKFDEEWIIDTDGTNLKEVLNMPFVDYTRTISNDMWEIHKIFGIEAVKSYLLMEFNNIISVGGTYINPRHILLLVNKMTYTGEIRAIARFGVESSQYGPLTRASFEEVMKHLIMAAIFSEVDNLNGVSSNIALGTKIRAGTGFFKTREIQLKVAEPKKIITEDL